MDGFNPRSEAAVDPVILAGDLTAMGYNVIYLDTNATRLRHAQMLRVKVLDMSEMVGKQPTRYTVAIAVNPSKFHTVNRLQWKELGHKQTIVIEI